ncbi:MAG TPA: TIGR03435 family protein, partial [Bryobacteraceae bacterium]
MSGQTQPDVSVVKPHPDNLPCGDTHVLPGGQLEAKCFTVELMVREGLNILPNQISGGPDWVRHDLWDISAKAASLAGKPEGEIYRQLLLGVASQRFSLKFHSVTRHAKGFALIVAEKGKLGRGLRPNSGKPHSFDVKPGASLSAHAITMSELAAWLRIPAGAVRTVVDQTGLAGLYDLDLRWTPLQSSRASDP